MSRAFLSDLMATILERGRLLLGSEAPPRLALNYERPIGELCDDLLSRRGEASGVTIAHEILDRYAKLDSTGRLAFFKLIATQFGPSQRRLEQAVARWQDGADAAADLHSASEPRRQELLRRLNHAPGGTADLVRMREHLLELLAWHGDLRIVDRDFNHLLSSWFNRGFLVLQPIDWTAPINILERIIRHEAVHAIENWDDLRNRLKPPDRRCFAFFHPQLVDEPLIFVEIALTKDIPSAIGPLLHPNRESIAAREATTAVFYSISNTQKGLAGVSFGNFLIKQVVAGLQQEFPHIRTFVTLSPLPGFARWLKAERQVAASQWLTPADRAELEELDRQGWYHQATRHGALQTLLLRLAASYLLNARNAAGRPLDPVARFHLGNGARVERLNVLADTSPRGLEQSHSIMVNYRYALDDVEKNHEAYAKCGTIIASPTVCDLTLEASLSRPNAAGLG